MKIKISKESNKVVFSYETKDKREFNYENINDFISERLNDLKSNLEFECDEGLDDYEDLLKKIDKEIREKDFLDAIEKIKSCKDEYENKGKNKDEDKEQ